MSMVLVLTWCGSDSATKDVIVTPFVVQISESYIKSSGTGDTMYRKGTGDEDATLIQFALTRVDSGVTLDQMTQLNLQKLSVSIPWYDYVSRTSRTITCDSASHNGIQVSFITNQRDEKLYHSQYYSIIQTQWYIWSVISTTDSATSTLGDIIKTTRCVNDSK